MNYLIVVGGFTQSAFQILETLENETLLNILKMADFMPKKV